MPLIIDGNNVLGIADLAEDQLIRALSVYCEQKSLTIELFFDGERTHGKRTRQFGRLHIHYSGPYVSADDQIISFASKVRDTVTWRLVSDDRELRRSLQEYGIKAQYSRELLAQLREQSRAAAAAQPDAKPTYEAAPDALLREMLKKK